MSAGIKYLLLHCLAVEAALAANVSIEYSSPVLRLILQGDDMGASTVVFHYNTGTKANQGVATYTTEGWQYLSRDVDLRGGDSIVAYAVLFSIKGYILETTDRVSLDLGNKVRRAALLPGRRKRGAVIFRDDFNYIDTSNWQYEISMYGGMNWEFQIYTPEGRNTFTKDGVLYIKPTPTTDDPRFDENFLYQGKFDLNAIWGYCSNMNNYGCIREGQYGLLPPIMSGKISSVATLRYGIVEVRAKIPKGDWIWPGIWMLPRDNVYGAWPRSGAIHIMESRGNNGVIGVVPPPPTGNNGVIGIESIRSTLHWGPNKDNDRYTLTQEERRGPSWHDEFHRFKLEWTPDYLSMFIDDSRVMEVLPDFWQKGQFDGSNIWAAGEKMAPFDKDFYIILNVAVGGVNGYFPDNIDYGVRKPWLNTSPRANEDFWNARNDWLPTWQGDETAMLIDWLELRHL